ncbi:MAG: hypothetical protein HY286_04980 [Planctomycetes bacterium]|nr:hypothetical protein [Planctomycetota bacterium]
MIQTPCILFALASFALAGGERTTQIYSLRAVKTSANAADANRASFGRFIRLPKEEAEPPLPYFNSTDAGVFNSSEILEILRFATAGSGDAPQFEIYEDSLLATASDEQHKSIKSAIAELAAQVAPVEVNVTVFALPYGSPAPRGGLLPAADIKNLRESLKNARVAWSGVVGSAPKRASHGGVMSTISFVASWHSEVAKKAKISEPWSGEISGGIEADVEATPLRGGSSVLLTSVVGITTLAGMERFETRCPNLGDIDIPKVAGARFATSSVVPAGSALLLRADDPDAGTILVLFQPRPADRKLKITNPQSNLFMVANALGAQSGRWLPDPFDATAPPAAMSQPNLSTLFKSESAKLRCVSGPGGSLLLIGDEPSIQNALAGFNAAENDEIYNSPIEIRVVRAADWAAAAAPNASIAATATLSASGHRSAGVVVGREETYVEGYNVSVAEESSVASPRVKLLFRGLRARARVLEAGEGTSTIELDVQYSEFGPRERQMQRSSDVGDHERVARQHSDIHKVFEVPKTGLLVLGELGASATPNEKLFLVVGAATASK